MGGMAKLPRVARIGLVFLASNVLGYVLAVAYNLPSCANGCNPGSTSWPGMLTSGNGLEAPWYLVAVFVLALWLNARRESLGHDRHGAGGAVWHRLHRGRVKRAIQLVGQPEQQWSGSVPVGVLCAGGRDSHRGSLGDRDPGAEWVAAASREARLSRVMA